MSLDWILKSMKYKKWIKLSEDEQNRRCQSLIVYDDWDLFKTVEQEFISQYGDQEGVGKVFCGLVGTLGPCNGIAVYIKSGKKRTKIPKQFLGFPVIKVYGKVT